jgi:hypothetical protein
MRNGTYTVDRDVDPPAVSDLILGIDDVVLNLTRSTPLDGSAFEQELSGALINWLP